MPMSTTNHFIFHKIPLTRTHSKYTPSLMHLQNPGRIHHSPCHPIAPGVTHQYDNIALCICLLPNRLLAPLSTLFPSSQAQHAVSIALFKWELKCLKLTWIDLNRLELHWVELSWLTGTEYKEELEKENWSA